MTKYLKLLQFLSGLPIFLLKSFEVFVQMNNTKLAAALRKTMYRTDCFIDTAVIIVNPHNFYAQKETALYHGCYILNSEGQFMMGARSHLGAYCYVNVCYGKVHIGDDVAIGPGTKLFSYSNHFKKGSKVTDIRITRNIEIGNNVFIGANCSILPGTVIHDNVIIGAGSVVKGELKSNAIYAGVPCRLLKEGWYE